MIIAIIRSRFRPGAEAAYGPLARELSAIVTNLDGYISHKTFIAEDGERLTFVEFASEDALRAWQVHPQHLEAKRRGRSEFFSTYSTAICQVIRSTPPRRGASGQVD